MKNSSPALQEGFARTMAQLIFPLALLLVVGCATGPKPAPISQAPELPTNAEGSDTSTSSAPCETQAADEVPEATECATVPKDYLAALALARRPKKENISRDLWTILHDNEKLQWNKEGQVLMTTWTNPKYYPPDTYTKGYVFPLYGDTFLTAVPEVKEWCTSYPKEVPGNLDYRLYQLLGLPPPPPDAYKRQFVEIWVSPQHLFRPCADPEITDHECQISVPFLGAKSPPTPTTEPPWLCPNPFLPPQMTGAFSQVNTASLSWICSWWETAYGNECPEENYPWTALGYTFDWGNLDDPVGPSEFVALGKSMVVFESMTPTAEYCGGAGGK